MSNSQPGQNRSICVFCGSSAGGHPRYAALAREFGQICARLGWRLVFGGGSVGLMGAAADGALEGGGEVVGIIPRILVEREVAHAGCTTMHVVETMDERKRLLAAESDCFVSLPGAIGTIDELSEMVTWTQIGFHQKPSGILNAFGYFDHLLAMFDHMVAEGFWDAVYRNAILVDDNIERLLGQLKSHQANVPAKFA